MVAAVVLLLVVDLRRHAAARQLVLGRRRAAAAASGRSSRRSSSRSSRRGCGTRFRRRSIGSTTAIATTTGARSSSFARDLNSDLDLERLSTRLVERVARDARRRSDRALPARSARRAGPASSRSRRAGSRAAPVPAIEPGSVLGARLVDGQTVVVDDPVPARRLGRRRSGAMARGRALQLRAVRVEGRHDCRDRGRAAAARRAAQQRGHDAARRGRRPGGDGARERAALRPAAAARPTRSNGCASSATASSSRSPTGWSSSTSTIACCDGTAGSRRSSASSAGGRSAAGSAALFSRPFVDTLVRGAARVARRARRSIACRSTAAHGDDRRAAARERRRSRRSRPPKARRPAGSSSSRTSPIAPISKSSCGCPRRWRRSGCSRPASRTKSTRRSPASRASRRCCSSGRDPDDPRTQLLEKIERQTFRAAKIVNSLLNLARPSGGEAGAGRPQRRRSATCSSLLEHQFKISRIQVRRELGAAGVVVRGVEYKLQQVFLNLFLNARDAMPKGGWLVGLDAASTAATRSSKWPTPASAFRPSTSRASTIRSSRRRPRAAAPASACR